MNNTLKCITIKKSPIDGKGVFSTQKIATGTILVCDLMIVDKSYELNDDIKKYYYPFSKWCWSICLGFGSFFNSSLSPNIKIYKLDKKNLQLYFITIKPIKKDEELFLKYKF
jgi:SET domain-containing protein